MKVKIFEHLISLTFKDSSLVTINANKKINMFESCSVKLLLSKTIPRIPNVPDLAAITAQPRKQIQRFSFTRGFAFVITNAIRMIERKSPNKIFGKAICIKLYKSLILSR